MIANPSLNNGGTLDARWRADHQLRRYGSANGGSHWKSSPAAREQWPPDKRPELIVAAPLRIHGLQLAIEEASTLGSVEVFRRYR